MRLLLTGAGGLLGGELARLLAARHALTALVGRRPAAPGVDARRADLTEPAALAGLLDELRPEAVVHAAALGDPDACERDPGRASLVNSLACGELARLCRARGCRLLLLSTDLVFDGSRPWAREDTPARPLQAYGRSKLEGERLALEAWPETAVVRSALVYGRGHGGRGSASESVAWALAAGRPARLFEDQFRTPVDAASLADLLERLLQRGGRGLFHAGGPERLSRLDLGRRVVRALGLDPALLVPMRQGDLPGAARPADVSLDSTRARAELGWEPRAVDEALRDQRPGPEATSGRS